MRRRITIEIEEHDRQHGKVNVVSEFEDQPNADPKNWVNVVADEILRSIDLCVMRLNPSTSARHEMTDGRAHGATDSKPS